MRTATAPVPDLRAWVRRPIDTGPFDLSRQGPRTAVLDAVQLAKRGGIAPDPWQADILSQPAAQCILLCSRQAGKSTIAAVLAVHKAVYAPPSLVLLLAPALRQSQELYRKVRVFLRAAGNIRIRRETELTIELMNGSRVVCLPGKEGTIRGYSNVSLLVVDEAARVPDDLYMAIRPMLAVSRGHIALLSTPFGKRGFFHREWTEGGDDWQRVKVTAHDCPRIDPQW